MHQTTAELRAHYQALTLEELEHATVDAILEHRRLVESEQMVYDEWESASGCVQSSEQLREMLKEECLRRRSRTFAQQDFLALLIELLGFIPQVPDSTLLPHGEA